MASGRRSNAGCLGSDTATLFLAMTPQAANAAAVTLINPGSALFLYPASLGWEFSPTENILVTDLGVFDQLSDGLAGSAQVGLFDNSGSLLASVTVPSGTTATLDNSFRYEAITPVSLQAGVNYVIGSILSSDNSALVGSSRGQGSSFSFDPAITFLSGRFSDEDKSGLFPNLGDTFSDLKSDFYLGPNFEFTSAVPVPAALPLFASGLVGLGWLSRRRRKQGQAAA